MAYHIDVQLIRQSTASTCWWAALRMVVETRRPGAIPTGHPDAMAAGVGQQIAYEQRRAQLGGGLWGHRQAIRDFPPRGLAPGEFPELAQRNGLRPVRSLRGNWTARELEATLQYRGPLWCAVVLGGMFPHVIVVHGVTPLGALEVADPQAGFVTWTVQNFNNSLAQRPDAVMYLAHPYEVPGAAADW